MDRTVIEQKLVALRQQFEQAKAQVNAIAGAIQFAEGLLAEELEPEKD